MRVTRWENLEISLLKIFEHFQIWNNFFITGHAERKAVSGAKESMCWCCFPVPGVFLTCLHGLMFSLLVPACEFTALLWCAWCPGLRLPGTVTHDSKALKSLRVESEVSQTCCKLCIISFKLWVWGLLPNPSVSLGSNLDYRHGLNVYILLLQCHGRHLWPFLYLLYPLFLFPGGTLLCTPVFLQRVLFPHCLCLLWSVDPLLFLDLLLRVWHKTAFFPFQMCWCSVLWSTPLLPLQNSLWCSRVQQMPNLLNSSV